MTTKDGLADELQLRQASLTFRSYAHQILKGRRGFVREARAVARRWSFKRTEGLRFAGYFISTVRGAAPVDGIELIRKRLPSRETAY